MEIVQCKTPLAGRQASVASHAQSSTATTHTKHLVNSVVIKKVEVQPPNSYIIFEYLSCQEDLEGDFHIAY